MISRNNNWDVDNYNSILIIDNYTKLESGATYSVQSGETVI